MYKIRPKTLFIGKSTEYFPSCHSTNDVATEIIQQKNALEGTIVVTDNQYAGRGQRGNSWEALPGQNVTFSIILRPVFLSPALQFQLNIAISLGIHDFLQSQKLENNTVKWPNDIYVKDRKMGGVLIESMLTGSKMGWSVIGIGLNINQLDFENPHAISMRMATAGREYAIPLLIEGLCEAIEKRYLQLKSGKSSEQKQAYINNLFRFEEWQEYRSNGMTFAGQISGISETGKLIMQTAKGTETFDFKEISYIL